MLQLNVRTLNTNTPSSLNNNVKFQRGNSKSIIPDDYDKFYEKHPQETWDRQAHVIRVMRATIPGSQYVRRGLTRIHALWNQDAAEAIIKQDKRAKVGIPIPGIPVPGAQYLYRGLGLFYGLVDKDIAAQNRIGFQLVREGRKDELTKQRKAALRQGFYVGGYTADGQKKGEEKKSGFPTRLVLGTTLALGTGIAARNGLIPIPSSRSFQKALETIPNNQYFQKTLGAIPDSPYFQRAVGFIGGLLKK